MKILVKFPTRGRRSKFLDTFTKYYDLCLDKNNIMFLITVDDDDQETSDKMFDKILNSYGNVIIDRGSSKNKIHAVNRGVNSINYDWDVLVLASDDMIPQVIGYDQIIRDNMNKFYPKKDGVLWFNDGFQGEKLNTLCILGKKYYEKFNYIYYPEYKSCWSDNEFMQVANILKKQTYIDLVIIKHEHPDWGFGQMDFVHHNNYKDHNFDHKLYLERKSNNFYI
jgi:hypothetical protein